ncbi:hypothetical protein CF326_g582 [Tilletia indica]|nr:hypothetical protein CF326_g582 [Tilletia indica]
MSLPLPAELISLIIQHACDNGDGVSVSQVSRQFWHLAESILYRRPTISSSQTLKLLVRSLSARPQLARHVTSLAIYTARVPFDVACRLATLLKPFQDRLIRLQVRFPASDLPLALDFLEALNPVRFEWITSPTWMIRPGNLFQRFLTKWTRLKYLTLGNFFLDSVLASSIAALPQITCLTLLGHSNKNLEVESVRTLLEGIPRLKLLEIGDCPLRRRVIIESELGIERSADDGNRCTREDDYKNSVSQGHPRQPVRLLLSRAHSLPVHSSLLLPESSTISHDGSTLQNERDNSRVVASDPPLAPPGSSVLAVSSAPAQQPASLSITHDHNQNMNRFNMYALKRFVSDTDVHHDQLAWHQRRVHTLRWLP